MVVEPSERGAVFVGEVLGDPNHRLSLVRGKICQGFAEMIMVGPTKLILDHDDGAVGKIAGKNVSAETAGTGLKGMEL